MHIIHSDLEFLMSICFIYDISDEKFKLYICEHASTFFGNKYIFVNAFFFVVGAAECGP